MIAPSAKATVDSRLYTHYVTTISTCGQLPLVKAMAARFPIRERENEELYEQGCIGLMKAISRFEHGCGISFPTFVVSSILKQMHILCCNNALFQTPHAEQEWRRRIHKAARHMHRTLGHAPTVTSLAAALRISPCELVYHMEKADATPRPLILHRTFFRSGDHH